MLQCMFVTSI